MVGVALFLNVTEDLKERGRLEKQRLRLESVIGNPVLHLYEETDREREKERLLE
jgi:hypothetical protein